MIHYRRTQQNLLIQEIPEKSDLVLFTDFPEFIEKRIQKVTRANGQGKKHSPLRGERVRQKIYWGLMQCKSLTAEIPKCMIQACYEKHRNILTKETSTDETVLESFRNFISPVVSRLYKEYRNKTFLATNHASFEASRGKGGIKETVTDQLTIDSQPFWALPGTDRPRLEPTMYVLSGAPGCGKSTQIESMITLMMRFLGTSYVQTVYHRNTNTDHWDGYCGQPIVVYDDFGQAQASYNQLADDTWEELITINSSAQYLVPMADLKAKGTKFISPIVILSTNLSGPQFYDEAHYKISSRDAIKRRIGKNFFTYLSDKHGHPSLYKEWTKSTGQDHYSIKSIENKVQMSPKYLMTLILNEWRRKSTFHQNEILKNFETFQPIGYETSLRQFGYVFPMAPGGVPDCKVQVLPEACKGRTITKHPANCHVLKPLQKALFKIVSDYACMKPCKTPDYIDELNDLEIISKELGHEDPLWISGDYSSATDGLHFDLSQVAMQEIAKVMDHIDPVVSSWVRYEGGKHLLHYPEHTKLPPALQENGQLMGSLLSFPILCLANAFTLNHSCGYELNSMPALFHGDDLAARMPLSDYEKWRDFAGQIGLTLSPGKNYVNKNWVSIDSQVYFLNPAKQCMEKLSTGRYGCFTPTAAGLKECLRSRKDISTEKLIERSGLNQKGMKTPRSIYVSETYGGIVPTTVEQFHGVRIENEIGRAPSSQLEKTIYGLKLSSKSPKLLIRGQSECVYKMSRKLQRYLKLRSVPSLVDEDQLETDIDEQGVDKKSLGPEAHLWRKIREAKGLYKDKSYQLFSKNELETVTVVIPNAMVPHLRAAWEFCCLGKHALLLQPNRSVQKLKNKSVVKVSKLTTSLKRRNKGRSDLVTGVLNQKLRI